MSYPHLIRALVRLRARIAVNHSGASRWRRPRSTCLLTPGLIDPPPPPQGMGAENPMLAAETPLAGHETSPLCCCALLPCRAWAA